MGKTRNSRKEREKAKRREEILEAALKLFSKKGFHDVSMREIADKSEFAIGTLYTLFVNKDSLLESLLHHYGEKIIGEITGVLDGSGNEAELLVAFIQCQPRILEKYSDIMKVYSAVFGTRGVVLSHIRDRIQIKEILNSKLTRLFERGIQKGLFRAVDPEIAAKSINSVIETIALENAGGIDPSKAIEIFQKIEQLFVGGLLSRETETNG
jgi:TetR/AcrR family transcriptional regulator